MYPAFTPPPAPPDREDSESQELYGGRLIAYILHHGTASPFTREQLDIASVAYQYAVARQPRNGEDLRAYFAALESALIVIRRNQRILDDEDANRETIAALESHPPKGSTRPGDRVPADPKPLAPAPPTYAPTPQPVRRTPAPIDF